MKSLKKNANDLFSEFIRHNHSDMNGMVTCVTCGKMDFWKGGIMQCGHGLEGRTNSILYQQDVAHPQCGPCNYGMSKPKSKIADLYRRFLIRQYGLDRYDELVAIKHQTWNLYDEDFENIINALQFALAEVELLRWAPTRPPQATDFTVTTPDGILHFRVDTSIDRYRIGPRYYLLPDCAKGSNTTI